MISDEWWIFHLTENGWVAGDYKLNNQNEVHNETPNGTLLTRKYYERLGEIDEEMERGIQDSSDVSQRAKELLKIFPSPNDFGRFPQGLTVA